MPKQTQYQIIKISTAILKQKKNNLDTISYEEAISQNLIVDIGDNMVFRKLRELKKVRHSPDELYDILKDLDYEIAQLKLLPRGTKVKTNY